MEPNKTYCKAEHQHNNTEDIHTIIKYGGKVRVTGNRLWKKWHWQQEPNMLHILLLTSVLRVWIGGAWKHLIASNSARNGSKQKHIYVTHSVLSKRQQYSVFYLRNYDLDGVILKMQCWNQTWIPELYIRTALYHSCPEWAIMLATRTLCQANSDWGVTRSYKRILNILFVVCNITNPLLSW